MEVLIGTSPLFLWSIYQRVSGKKTIYINLLVKSALKTEDTLRGCVTSLGDDVARWFRPSVDAFTSPISFWLIGIDR